MSKSQTAAIALLITLILASMPLSKPQAQAATPKANQPAPIEQPAGNKFCKRWTSSITLAATGETLDDGIIEISDAGVANSGEVIVHHSRYAGLHRGYTLSYPDRIEIQIPLGDGRVAHYNGVLVSRKEIQGHFFVTEAGERMQSHHGHKRRAVAEDTFTAKGNE